MTKPERIWLWVPPVFTTYLNATILSIWKWNIFAFGDIFGKVIMTNFAALNMWPFAWFWSWSSCCPKCPPIFHLMLLQFLVEVQLEFFYWLILNCFRNIATPPWLFKTSKLSPLGSVGVKILRSVAFELTCNIEQLEELQLLSSKVFLSNVLYPSPKLDIWWEIPDTVSSGKWSNLARVMKKVPIFVRKKYYICSKNSLYFAQKTNFFKWKNFLYLSEKN